MLRRQHAAFEEKELPGLFRTKSARPLITESRFRSARGNRPGSTAADRGIAHHTFLQLLDLSRAGDAEQLRGEANRLVSAGSFSNEEAEVLSFEAIARFWSSDLGAKIRAQLKFLRRELAFTARFSEAELPAITGEPGSPDLADEFVVVQG